MCGRFTRLYTWKRLHELLDIRWPGPGEMKGSWNVAPSQITPVCRLNAAGGRELVPMRWGFTPRWSKDGKPGPINARAETVVTNGLFRDAFRARRLLLPVSGFYEWKVLPEGKTKRPYYIRSARDDDPFVLAGLWEGWRPHDAGVEPVESFALITTEPNELMATLHDRMPVILDPRDWDDWLDAKSSATALRALLRPCPSGLLAAFPVSTAVNSPRHDAPDCIAPLTND